MAVVAGDVRTRIVIDADARQAITALEAVDKAADAADRALDGITDRVSVDVTADTGQVTAAAADVDRLRNLARDPVRIPIDIADADLDRVARTRDGIRDVGVNAEGLQRGIGPLRGFTDELGGTAGAAGTATNALIDAGEAVEIFGAQLGLSEQTLGRVSLALGGIGLAVGAATFAWSKYREAQQKARERAEELVEVQRQLSDGKYREAAEKLADTYGDLFADLDRQGIDVATAMRVVNGELDTTLDRLQLSAAAGDQLAAGTVTLADGFAKIDVASAAALIRLRDDMAAAGTELAGTTATTDALEAALAGTGRTASTTADDIDGITSAFQALSDEISRDRSALDLADTFDAARDAAYTAWQTAAAGGADADARARDYQRSLLDAKDAVIDVATEVGGIPARKVVEINAAIAAGDIDEAERLINEVTRKREVLVLFKVPAQTPNYVTPRPTGSSTGSPAPPPAPIVNQTINVRAAPTMRDVDAAATRWRRIARGS